LYLARNDLELVEETARNEEVLFYMPTTPLKIDESRSESTITCKHLQGILRTRKKATY
jgi:hypothetical protein